MYVPNPMDFHSSLPSASLVLKCNLHRLEKRFSSSSSPGRSRSSSSWNALGLAALKRVEVEAKAVC